MIHMLACCVIYYVIHRWTKRSTLYTVFKYGIMVTYNWHTVRVSEYELEAIIHGVKQKPVVRGVNYSLLFNLALLLCRAM